MFSPHISVLLTLLICKTTGNGGCISCYCADKYIYMKTEGKKM